MEVELQEDVIEKVDLASQLLGIRRQELVDRAVLLYLDNMSKYLDLKQEFKDWDQLSDEALVNFEAAL